MIPIGSITNVEPEHQLCKDLKLHWTKSFQLLGFDIDSELANLNQNLETRLLKVEALILRWERRNLTTSGRVAISKAILLSQFIYFLQVLDVDKTDICEKIEKTLHNFIKGKTKRNWISADMINTPKSKYKEIHHVT